MSATRLLLLALLLPCALSACENVSDQASVSDITAAQETEQYDDVIRAPGQALQGTPDRREPQLIQRANLSLRVDNYAEAAAAVPRIVGTFDAYLAGEQERRHSYRVSNTYTIRVASAQFDSLLTALGVLADEYESRTISVDDVSEEFIDLEARLNARRAVEARYTELLARARNVDEVLSVQARLAEVREEIERAEGRFRYLQDRVAMSTVELTLFEESAAGLASGPGFFRRLATAFGTGWEVLLEGLIVIVAAWPFWVLLLLALLGRRAWRQRNASVS